MEVIKSGHGTYRLEYHVVWVVKYRRKVLNPGVCEYLKSLMPKLLRSMPGVTMEPIGFDKDHLHIVMVIPPKYAIAGVMRILKSQSASLIREKFKWLKKVFWSENVVWSPGYFVSSVGIDRSTILRYVEHQGRQDSGQLRMEL